MIKVLFMLFWLVNTGYMGITMLLDELLKMGQDEKEQFSPMVLFPLGMFIFGYLMTYFGFKSESKKSKRFLATLLAGEEMNG